MSHDFSVEILSQEFMSPHDFSSHGRVRAVIAGKVVTSDEPEYGITQSALSLLRTLESDRPTELDLEHASPLDYGFLLCHDCGFPISFGCPNFGTNWDVRHEDGNVTLSNALFVDSSGVNRLDAVATVTLTDYGRPIAAFAREARRAYFADGAERTSDMPDFDERFWAEFDSRLKRAETAISAE